MDPNDAEERIRAHWPNRIWRRSAEGNFYLNAEGFNIVLFYRNDVWRVRVENRDNGLSQVGRKTYPTLEAAKMAALAALVWARAHL